MFARNLAPLLLKALKRSPVVLLTGARQTGKSTLARAFADGVHPATYFTLDDAAVLAAAAADPQGFVSGLRGDVVLDEVQRVPELFRAIKLAVDSDRRSGRFLLTGSANPLFLPQLSESLAGRVEVLTLWPLSQGEMEGRVEGFIERVFAADFDTRAEHADSRAELVRRMVRGGFPDAVGRDNEGRRAWLGSYVTTTLQRDVRELARIDGLTDFPRLLALAAARTSSLLNLAELSRSSGLALTTLRRYVALLEATFLLHTVPAWTGNIGKRLVKAPKLLMCDSGLAAHLTGRDAERLVAEPDALGPLLETFVGGELLKQTAWSGAPVRVHHFRSQTGQEVDFVLEHANGGVVGVEVKATASLGANAMRGLNALGEAAGKRFKCGVVLYNGKRIVPFGEKLFAVPIAGLWA
jgi:uncharacterized protein